MDNNDIHQDIAHGIKHFLEMGILNNDAVKTHLISSVFLSHKDIKDVNMLIDERRSEMLVFVDLSFWSMFFRKEEIVETVKKELLNQLPTYYKVCVVYSKKLFNQSIDRIKEQNSVIQDKIKENKLKKDKESEKDPTKNA